MAALFIAIAIGVGCVLAIPYAFFCKAVILGFLVIPYSILVGSIVGATFAHGALRRRSDEPIWKVIAWGAIAGGATMPIAQPIISAIGVCPGLFLSPVLLPLFGGVGTVLYLACEKGTRGKRDRAREQRYRRAIAEHAEEATKKEE